MSDDEVIRFEITDYDLDNEFNPNRNRRAKKEHQIYGVWAKDSDEEDNEDNIRRRSRKPKDFSAPIDFVTGGIQQAGKKKEEKKEIRKSEPSSSHPKFADSSDEEVTAPEPQDTAGIRKAGQGLRTLGGVGAWEKHTKGIGAKLLLQMGYQPGKGLGKDLQGISAPVEATVRKGRGAIGAYGPEKSVQKAKKEEERRLKEKEEQENVSSDKNYNWKKSHKGRYFYRDAADVIQEGKPTMHTISSNELSRVPVIDLTGREKKVLSGYHALRAAAPRYEHEPRRDCTYFTAPELTHNLQLMVDCCEQDIIQNARELQQAEDEIVVLQRDLQECETQLREEDGVVLTLQGLLERAERLARSDADLHTSYEVLRDIKETFPLEYEMFSLGTIGGNIVGPLFSAMMAKWNPLQNPDEPVPVFLQWRELLTEDAYNSLLWQHFIPSIKRFRGRLFSQMNRSLRRRRSWNPRVPEPMLRVLSSWARACPPWVPGAVGSRAVAPRLLAAVRAWDPTRDTQPLHQWVLPWHETAGEALAAGVYPLIRSRLAAALAAWHPADASARPLLEAWRSAWGPALAPLVLHHIVPKLEHCLQNAPLELVGRENTAWLWCVDWVGVAGAAAVAGVAARALLPRWLAALAAWINTGPPHATLLASYTAFKKMFPEEVLKEPAVRDAFRKALDMMNRSTDAGGLEMPPAPPPPPRFDFSDQKDATRMSDVLASVARQKSFSELLESRCIEKGITFVPVVGKSREGRPLYKIGELQCYVIRNVIMYSDDGGRSFGPIGLDRLLNLVED